MLSARLDHLARAIAIAALAACGGAQSQQSSTAKPPGKVRSVKVLPASLVLQPGTSFKFTAVVDAAAGFDQTVIWRLENSRSPGSIDADGTYHAPNAPSGPAQIIAESAADPSRTGGATVTFPPFSFDIQPRQAQLFNDDTLRFTAALSGVASPVQWNAMSGSFDADGTYHAPHFSVRDEITASCEGCAFQLSARIDVWQRAPILETVSGPAMPGEVITITGKYLWYAFVAFPAPGGGQIRTGPCLSPTSDGTSITVSVPPGSGSGDLHVEAVGLPEQGPVISNSLHFERAPQVLLHAERSLLGAGESTHLKMTWLGAPGPLPLVYDTDVGDVADDGTYVAPADLTAPAFAHVRACVPGPRDCSSVVIEIDPFRVAPDAPLLAPGSSLALDVVGGRAAATEFMSGSGGTNVTPDGFVTAGTTAEDSGPDFVLARRGPIDATVEVAVSGFGPGLANRIVDPVDYTLAQMVAGNPTAPFAQAVAVSGGRAYVLEDEESLKSENVPNRKIWIDVYDLADPMRPRWTGAVDCPIDATYLVTAGGYLYAASLYGAGAMPVYDISGPVPILVGAPEGPPIGTGYLSPPVRDGERLIFFGQPSRGQSTFELRIYEPSVDPLAYKAVTAHLPDNAFLDLGTYAIAASGDRAYATYSIWDPVRGGQGEVTLGVWDTGANPAAFLGSIPLGGDPADLSLAGPLLLVGSRVFDRRGALPVDVTPFPFAMTALAGDGNRYLARESWSGVLYLVDVSDPAAPRISASLDPAMPAPIFPRSAALSGNVVYAPQGIAGLGVYDVSAAGGPLPRRTLTMGWNNGTMTAVVARNGIVYATGHGFVSSSSDDDALAAWDTSNPQTTAATVQVLPHDPAWALALADGDRLLRGGTASLEVWSIANPLAPALSSSTPLGVSCIAVQGGVAWIGTLDGQVAAFDLQAGSEPVALGQAPAGGLPWAFAFVGPATLAVATATDTGGDLVLFDISVPAQPRRLGSAGIGAQSYGVATSGTTAAVATDLGLVTVDVSDVTRPAMLGLFPLPQSNPYSGWEFNPTPSAISIHDGLAWIGTLQAGSVYAYDLKNPAWPRLVGRADARATLLPTDGVRGFAFDGGSMFVVGALGTLDDFALGLEVYEFDISSPRNQLLPRSPAQALMRKIP